MNSTVLFLYFLLFMTTLVSAVVFMWKSMTESFKALGDPIRTNVHPEMRDVQSGTELLVFMQERKKTRMMVRETS